MGPFMSIHKARKFSCFQAMRTKLGTQTWSCGDSGLVRNVYIDSKYRWVLYLFDLVIYLLKLVNPFISPLSQKRDPLPSVTSQKDSFTDTSKWILSGSHAYGKDWQEEELCFRQYPTIHGLWKPPKLSQGLTCCLADEVTEISTTCATHTFFCYIWPGQTEFAN